MASKPVPMTMSRILSAEVAPVPPNGIDKELYGFLINLMNYLRRSFGKITGANINATLTQETGLGLPAIPDKTKDYVLTWNSCDQLIEWEDRGTSCATTNEIISVTAGAMVLHILFKNPITPADVDNVRPTDIGDGGIPGVVNANTLSIGDAAGTWPTGSTWVTAWDVAPPPRTATTLGSGKMFWNGTGTVL